MHVKTTKWNCVRLWAPAMMMGLSLIACGDDDAVEELASVTMLIGPAGGEVNLASGAKVEIPSGALSAMTEIKISEKSPRDVAALGTDAQAASEKPIAFEPHGTQFALPVKISLPFDRDSAELTAMKLNDDADTTWENVAVMEKAAGKLVIATTSFSIYWPVRPSGVLVLPDAGVDASTPDSGVDAATAVDAATDAEMDAATACVDHGGCDSLTTCMLGSDGEAQCGACPTGYVGDGASGCRPELLDLVPAFGTLSPAFEPTRADYTMAFPFAQTFVRMAGTPPDFARVMFEGNNWSNTDFMTDLTLGATGLVVQAMHPDNDALFTTYNVTATRGAQTAYVKAAVARAEEHFGHALALYDDTLVVGAPGDDSGATGINGDPNNVAAVDSGAVYVFVKSGGSWVQQAYLKASNTGAGDEFGFRVALDLDMLVVGARYEDSNATGLDGNQANNTAQDSGAVYVFRRNAGVWTQEAYLKASNTGAGDRFGESVDVSGDLLVVGAPGEYSAATTVNGDQTNNTAPLAGAAYVFRRSGIWLQEAYLKASNAEAGDFYGWSVAIDGNLVAVGALNENSSATSINGNQADNATMYAGAVYTYTFDGSNWVADAYLKASHPYVYGAFGTDLALQGNRLVVGAQGDGSTASGIDGDATTSGAADSGAVYVFSRSGSTWSREAYFKAAQPQAGDLFGMAVSLHDNYIVVGAAYEGSASAGLDAGSK